jgi:hypothetical protein
MLTLAIICQSGFHLDLTADIQAEYPIQTWTRSSAKSVTTLIWPDILAVKQVRRQLHYRGTPIRNVIHIMRPRTSEKIHRGMPTCVDNLDSKCTRYGEVFAPAPPEGCVTYLPCHAFACDYSPCHAFACESAELSGSVVLQASDGRHD